MILISHNAVVLKPDLGKTIGVLIHMPSENWIETLLEVGHDETQTSEVGVIPHFPDR